MRRNSTDRLPLCFLHRLSNKYLHAHTVPGLDPLVYQLFGVVSAREPMPGQGRAAMLQACWKGARDQNLCSYGRHATILVALKSLQLHRHLEARQAKIRDRYDLASPCSPSRLGNLAQRRTVSFRGCGIYGVRNGLISSFRLSCDC